MPCRNVARCRLGLYSPSTILWVQRRRLPSTASSRHPAESLGVNHGGVAVIAAGGARLSIVPVDVHPTTFEHVSVRVDINRHVCTVVTVYRPGSEFVQSAFFDELADLLDTVATRAEPVYLVGEHPTRSC